MNTVKKSIVAVGILVLIIAFLSQYASIKGTTAPIKDAHGDIMQNSIAKFVKPNINGVGQSILIRGQNKDNPVLLFVHGGPGYSEMGEIRKCFEPLEKHFTLAIWDQRGAGKSYSAEIPQETMTMEQFIEDTKEVSIYLKSEFNKEKIYIVGHSWGSMLGLLTVQRYPELYHAYVGVGQLVDAPESEDIIYKYLIEKAEFFGSIDPPRILKEIGPPVKGMYKDARGTNGGNINGMALTREMLNLYGGMFRNQKVRNERINRWLMREYTLKEALDKYDKTVPCEKLLNELRATDMRKKVPEVKIPVYFFEGRYDYQAPSVLAEQYCNMLKAPKKELIWFEESAHYPNREESEKFNDMLISKVLKETNR